MVIFCTFRLWNLSKSRNYCIDVINFGPGFSMENNFDLKFNPALPLVAIKYYAEFWLMLLPGPRRRHQGQILYRYHVPQSNWHLDTCEWSTLGNKLLLTIQTAPEAVRIPGQLTVEDRLQALIFLVEDSRGRYHIKELKNSLWLVPGCKDSMQLSGKKRGD